MVRHPGSTLVTPACCSGAVTSPVVMGFWPGQAREVGALWCEIAKLFTHAGEFDSALAAYERAFRQQAGKVPSTLTLESEYASAHESLTALPDYACSRTHIASWCEQYVTESTHERDAVSSAWSLTCFTIVSAMPA